MSGNGRESHRLKPHDFIASLPITLYVGDVEKMEAASQPGPEPAGIRERLSALREALLHLHKALLDSERISYEASLGHISSPYQFLHLVTNDPWFAWLTPVTRLIASMDVMLDAKEPLTEAGVEAVVRETAALLVASAEGEGFARHYDEALQRSPDVILAHAVAAKLIRAK
jgi:hypothetical protein